MAVLLQERPQTGVGRRTGLACQNLA